MFADLFSDICFQVSYQGGCPWILRRYTLLNVAKGGFTRFYEIIRGYAWLYVVIRGYRSFFVALHNYTWLCVVIRRYTWL